MKLKTDNHTDAQTASTNPDRAERVDCGDVIPADVRAQVIVDGILIDVSDAAREVGFQCPVAMTAFAWESTVRLPDGVIDQEEGDRLWDVLYELRWHLSGRRIFKKDEVWFRVSTVQPGNQSEQVKLIAMFRPGDGIEQVITIMLGED